MPIDERRCAMKRTLTVLVAALALVLVPLGAAETSYIDPAGDSGSAPDITAVSVSNETPDSFFSPIVIRLTAPMTTGSRAGVFMDTDLDPSTGLEGIDRILVLNVIGGDFFVPVWLNWNGDDFVESATTIVSRMELTPTTLAVGFPKGPIEKGFSFFVLTLGPGDDPPPGDEAPDAGMWTYVLSVPQTIVKPIIGAPVTTAGPIAGKRFVVSFAVTRSDDGKPMTSATVGCKTTVAGKTVRHTHTFANGKIKAVVTMPNAAKGKQLKVALKVTADGQAAAKVVTFKIR
jgi:hypothetical protein